MFVHPDQIPLYHLDVFTNRLFGGNPAAVCVLNAWLPATVLQQIAAENNLSETAFIVPQGDDYHLRWFTALTEVELCGHGTLAAGFVVLHYLQPERQAVTFQTLSGALIVQRHANGLQMRFPRLAPKPVVEPLITEILGKAPQALYKANAYLAILPTEQQVRETTINVTAFRRLAAPGLIVSATGGEIDFVSRYFSTRQPAIEDPVTGSAHCTLTPYWAERLGKTVLHARQLSARSGEMMCELKDDFVYLTGQARIYLQGEIQLAGVS